MQKNKLLLIEGARGSGKTQLLHMIGLYQLAQDTAHAYYFDFSVHAYTAADMKAMVASVPPQAQDGKVEKNVGGSELFLLDNLDQAENTVHCILGRNVRIFKCLEV